MNNFRRALSLALKHRPTLIASMFCAVAVAGFWGFNIGFIYPVVEVLNGQKSLQALVEDKIAKIDANVATIEEQIKKVEEKIAAAPQDPDLASDLRKLNWRLEVEQASGEAYRWVKPFVDRFLPHDAFKTLLVFMMVLLVGTIVKDLFLIADALLVDRLTHLATRDLRKLFYRRTLRLDMASFGNSGTNELMSRFISDVDSVGSGIQLLLGKVIREPLKLMVCLAGAAFICWRLLLFSLLLAPILAYVISRLAKSLKRANRRALEEISHLYSILGETFSGIKIVKAFTMERYERQRFHRNSKQLYRKAIKISFYDSLIHPLTEMMGISAICVGMLSGAYLVLNQETHLLGLRMSNRPLEWGTLVVFYGFIVGMTDPARKLSEVFNRLQRASAAADRVYEMLDREPSVWDPPKPKALPRHNKDLVFDGIQFSYVPGQPVLEDVNLRIPFGETLAIVGANGCGKSTLVNLIPRFYDPLKGSVRLDGIDLRDVRVRDLRRQVGLVTQETLLFDDTVYNNIRYGSPHATRHEVIEAAKQAHAHRFIESDLEYGYETEVGQFGGRLSGGQRQRIALARAILRDPAIMILDEATSQTDLESEQLIHMALDQFVRNRTAIIITHRLSTLDLADRILVMQDGQIIDLGTHNELLSRCDLYQRLYQIQFKQSA